MAVQRIGDLELEHDLRFHQRFWRIQRLGWIVMALIIIAALLGLFGSGPLSSATARTDGGGLTVDYHRFGRFESPSNIELSLGPDAIQGDQAQIWISSSYLSSVQLENISPEPDSVEIGSDRQILTFAIAESTDPAHITLHTMPEEPGIHNVELGIVDGSSVSIRQLIFP